MATAVRVRKDIWDLGDEGDPWADPIILAYAEGVGAMQALVTSDPTNPANWVNQAAMHEHQGPSVPGRLEDQCQHACWFFLPWHRMYLYWFEQIVRSHLSPSSAEEWALPYWNYSDVSDRRKLPPAFRRQQLPDGSPNPLFTPLRQTSPLDINGGTPMDAPAVKLTQALQDKVFSRPLSTGSPTGFGGGRTNPLFHHTSGGPWGPLEGTPHGAVHNQVGGFRGLMTQFFTAALDPIFWLHHANIDRLWEQWRRGNPPGTNSTDSDWLTMTFDFVDETGAVQTSSVEDVLEIEAQLFYTYSGLPPAPAPASSAKALPDLDDVADDLPAELIGASDEPVTLEGASAAATSFAVSQPQGPALQRLDADGLPAATYLNIEDIEGEANPGLLYGVYVNLPAGERPDPESPHFAGVLSFFGIESTKADDGGEEAPHRLRQVFDISDTVAALAARDQWNPGELHVTFAPIGVEAGTQLDEARPPVSIGRVSLFVA